MRFGVFQFCLALWRWVLERLDLAMVLFDDVELEYPRRTDVFIACLSVQCAVLALAVSERPERSSAACLIELLCLNDNLRVELNPAVAACRSFFCQELEIVLVSYSALAINLAPALI